MNIIYIISAGVIRVTWWSKPPQSTTWPRSSAAPTSVVKRCAAWRASWTGWHQWNYGPARNGGASSLQKNGLMDDNSVTIDDLHLKHFFLHCDFPVRKVFKYQRVSSCWGVLNGQQNYFQLWIDGYIWVHHLGFPCSYLSHEVKLKHIFLCPSSSFQFYDHTVWIPLQKAFQCIIM